MKALIIKITLIIITISALTFLSLACVAAIEEGTQGSGISGLFAFVFSTLFYVLRFPTHTLFIENLSSAFLFIFGLAINILFWTAITFVVTHYLKKQRG